jgi:HEPN domain-containing protein
MSVDHAAEALRWLSFAIGDLEAARSHRGHHVRPRIVAFEAQQCAEKALKAALILEAIEPRRTHDLEELRGRLPAGWRVKTRPSDLARLSDYAAESRYPDDLQPVTPLQSAIAVRQAIALLKVIRVDFERRGVDTAKVVGR